MTRYCSVCGKVGDVRACAGCRSLYYCSTKCQKSHWKKHKPDCLEVQTGPKSDHHIIKKFTSLLNHAEVINMVMHIADVLLWDDEVRQEKQCIVGFAMNTDKDGVFAVKYASTMKHTITPSFYMHMYSKCDTPIMFLLPGAGTVYRAFTKSEQPPRMQATESNLQMLFDELNNVLRSKLTRGQ